MNVLITGGAGYIGSALVKALLSSEAISTITVYDNLSSGNYSFFKYPFSHKEKLKFVQADILDTRKLRAETAKSDIIVHLATLETKLYACQESHAFEHINNWGTCELASAAEAAGNVKKIIYLSSTEVYGSTITAAKEDTPLNPQTFYAHSVARAEDYVKRLDNKMKAIVLRSGSIYGDAPVMTYHSLINQYMIEAQAKGRIQIQGSGKQILNFVSIHKVVAAIQGFILQEAESGVYNLGGINISILDLLDVLKEVNADLEFVFINHHIEYPSLSINSDKLDNVLNLGNNIIKEELQEMKRGYLF